MTMNKEKEEKDWYLISYGKRKKVYVMLYVEPFDAWIDSSALPETCLLCAMCDGTSLKQCVVKKADQRTFFNIEWLLKEWGGAKEYIQLIQELKENLIKEADKIKQSNEVL